jgi:hypothetical protein
VHHVPNQIFGVVNQHRTYSAAQYSLLDLLMGIDTLVIDVVSAAEMLFHLLIQHDHKRIRIEVGQPSKLGGFAATSTSDFGAKHYEIQS